MNGLGNHFGSTVTDIGLRTPVCPGAAKAGARSYNGKPPRGNLVSFR